MPILHDQEFGDITITRSARASRVSIRVAPNGSLRATLPTFAPLFSIKRLLKTSRNELRQLLDSQRPKLEVGSGDKVGKSHSIELHTGHTLRVTRQKLRIIATLPETMTITHPDVQALLRKEIIAALRREAKSYLPKRLAYVADQFGFTYTSIRITHAGSRWGSCSSGGTISLNLALMKLPFELIDYVIIHELAHTRHMNHSDHFWQLVEQFDPDYKTHRRALKQETPHI